MMDGAPGAPTKLARTVATAGALTAVAGVALYPSWGIEITYALPAVALGASAILLHVRSTSAQLVSRGLWVACAALAATRLGFGRELASALVLGGSATALGALGSTGLGKGEARGTFDPAKYRAPLVVSLILAIAMASGLAWFGTGYLEAFGALTPNLFYAAALGAGAYGLARMRTWGLLLLGGANAWLAATVFGRGAGASGALAMPYVLNDLFGVASLATLVGLAPLLFLAAKRLGTSEATQATTYRIATVPQPTVSPIADSELDAELDAAAAAESASPPQRRRISV